MLCACAQKGPIIHTPLVMPEAKPLKDTNVALVLGGGGARGLAHVGVLSVLEENEIPIDLIVGTSIGSIVGALYSDQPDSQKLLKKMIHVRTNDIIDFDINSSLRMLWGVGGLANGYGIQSYLHKNLETKQFEHLKIPLAIVSTDIDQGDLFVIRSGPIIPAAHASSAIPVVFTPVKLYGRTLVDGGVISPVPVEVAKDLGAKKIIAVDIGNVIRPTEVKGTYELADRCLWISYLALSRSQTNHCDVLIEPEFQGTSTFDDTQLYAYYEAGRLAALKALPQIKAMLESSTPTAS